MKMLRRFFSVAPVLALCSILSFAALSFQSQADEKDSPGKSKPQKSAELPKFILDLKPSAEQQEKIQASIQKSDAQIAEAWNEFQTHTVQSVIMEALVLAAIEDGLSDVQRESIREHRSRTYKTLPSVSETQKTSAKKTPENPESETLVVGIALSPAQQAEADKVHSNYADRLKALREETHGLHWRLVALEAEKIASIEKLLTAPQLQQLREGRKSPPPAVAHAKTR